MTPKPYVSAEERKRRRTKTDKVHPRVMEELVIDEIALVDRPMQEQPVPVMKRAVDKRVVLTTNDRGHTHSFATVIPDGGERMSGETSYAEDSDGRMHSHPWVMDDAGQIMIGDANGHAHGIAVMNKMEHPPSHAASSDQGTAAGQQAAEEIGDPSEDTKMTKQDDKAADKDQAVSKEEFEALKAKNERQDKILTLKGAQRDHFETLEGENDQDEFLGKSDEERDEIVKNAQEADRVVYTSPYTKRQVRASEGETTLAEVKRADDLQKRLDEGEAREKRSGFVKQAQAELPHLKGGDDAKADLLEAVSALPADKQAPVMEMLKAQDAGLGKAFERIGVQGNDPEAGTAEDQLAVMAKRIAKDEKCTVEQGYVKALETEEGQRLYAEANR